MLITRTNLTFNKQEQDGDIDGSFDWHE